MTKRKKPSARRSQQRTMFGAAKSGAVQMQKIAFKAAQRRQVLLPRQPSRRL